MKLNLVFIYEQSQTISWGKLTEEGGGQEVVMWLHLVACGDMRHRRHKVCFKHKFEFIFDTSVSLNLYFVVLYFKWIKSVFRLMKVSHIQYTTPCHCFMFCCYMSSHCVNRSFTFNHIYLSFVVQMWIIVSQFKLFQYVVFSLINVIFEFEILMYYLTSLQITVMKIKSLINLFNCCLRWIKWS